MPLAAAPATKVAAPDEKFSPESIVAVATREAPSATSATAAKVRATCPPMCHVKMMANGTPNSDTFESLEKARGPKLAAEIHPHHDCASRLRGRSEARRWALPTEGGNGRGEATKDPGAIVQEPVGGMSSEDRLPTALVGRLPLVPPLFSWVPVFPTQCHNSFSESLNGVGVPDLCFVL